MNIFVAPFVNALVGLYYFFGNFGWAVIAITVIIRILLLPLVMPTLRSSKKMMLLQPKLKKIQEEFKNDKKALAAAQMELYKKEGINPLSGCLPQIAQIAVLIIFFSAFNTVVNYSIGKGSLESVNKNLLPSLQLQEDHKMNLVFFGSDLSHSPSQIYKDKENLIAFILPLFLLLGSAVLQFWSSKLMMPSTKTDQLVVEKVTKDKEDDMMATMRTQSLYMMPAMTLFIGWGFNLGILLYWFMNSLVMLIQQLAVEKKPMVK
jgi:YidC/Oxa1 family membrane protein insertase